MTPARSTTPGAPPNVLLVVVDGARADHLSCYGHARDTTPFVDRLAREGVRFTQAVACAASTVAAHASLFTGLYPVTHGVTDERPRLDPGRRVLAECLRDAGYATAAFCANPAIAPETGFGRGFDEFVTGRGSGSLTGRAWSYGRRAGDRLLRRDDAGARRTTEAAAGWVARAARPFFAFVHYDEARPPFRLPAPFDRHFLTRTVGSATIRAVNQDPLRLLAAGRPLAEEELAVFGALYDAALRYVDARLEELAAALAAHDAWESTLVVVTADHGQALGERGRVGHNFDLAEGVLRIPLLLRCPGRVPGGFVSEEIAQTVDILPTILRLVGVEPPAGIHGHSLLEGGRMVPGPAFAIAERYRPRPGPVARRLTALDAATWTVREKAIRTRRYKYVWRSDEQNAFFDLQADPAERTNLIEAYDVEAEALRDRLFDWLASVEKSDFRRGPDTTAKDTA